MHRSLAAALALLGMLLSAPSIARGSDEVGGLSEEIVRLQRLVESTQIEDDSWSQIQEHVGQGLREVAAEDAAGRQLLALSRLTSPRNTLLAYLYSAQQANSEEFDAEWREAQEELLARAPAVPTETGAVVRALAEAARLQLRPYHAASSSMAAATSNKSGLFYLGRAHAHADFVEWSGTLGLRGTLPPPPLRKLDAELEQLEREILEAYVPPRSIDRHSDFIVLHASFKLARELNEEGYRFGALNQYLDASTRLGAILSGAADTSDPAKLRETIGGLVERLRSEERDHGIAALYLEMAESALGDEPARARTIVDRVLPAYFAAIEASKIRETPDDASVRVTLVRWPYT